MSLDAYRATPRRVRNFITDVLIAGLVPFVQSSPGVGKSSIVRSIAKEQNLKLIDHRLSTSEPTDLSGLPHFVDGKAVFAPFADLFPTEDMQIPLNDDGEPYNGWLLFLDEFNSADKRTQAACYKLILDRMTGQKHLHENVAIVCAGNLVSDRAITNPIGTAMQSRVIHLEMEHNFDDWMYDVALKENYDSRIIAYLSQYPNKLMDFNPEHSEKTFCCPRTWEFMNRLVKGNTVSIEKAPMYAGTITSGVALDFIQFTKVFDSMVTIGDIIKDPKTCPVPSDISTQWAVIAHMMEFVDDKNFTELGIYANKFPMSFRILFYRSVIVRHGHLRSHPTFATALTELSSYLFS